MVIPVSMDLTTEFHPSTAVKDIKPLAGRTIPSCGLSCDLVTHLNLSVLTQDIGTSSSAQNPMLWVPVTGGEGHPISAVLNCTDVLAPISEDVIGSVRQSKLWRQQIHYEVNT